MADNFSRRNMLQITSIAGLAALTGCDAVQFPGADSKPDGASEGSLPPPPNPTPARLPSSNTAFNYEIVRSDEDWRARLTPAEYNILRQGGTEPRHSHRYTQLNEAGIYHCQGCDLPIYDASEKVILDIGWAFFYHSRPDTVLIGRDDEQLEAHCRRCGGHLGHLLFVEKAGEILHCINGTALEFKAA